MRVCFTLAVTQTPCGKTFKMLSPVLCRSHVPDIGLIGCAALFHMRSYEKNNIIRFFSREQHDINRHLCEWLFFPISGAPSNVENRRSVERDFIHRVGTL